MSTAAIGRDRVSGAVPSPPSARIWRGVRRRPAGSPVPALPLWSAQLGAGTSTAWWPELGPDMTWAPDRGAGRIEPSSDSPVNARESACRL